MEYLLVINHLWDIMKIDMVHIHFMSIEANGQSFGIFIFN
jgi:hypothetical protein